MSNGNRTVLLRTLLMMYLEMVINSVYSILGDPGAASRDDGISWAKVHNKSGRAPGHLLLPNEFQKRLKSRLLIIFWPISEEEQPGDSHVFLHEVVFLIERRSSVARSTGTFLRRASEKINK